MKNKVILIFVILSISSISFSQNIRKTRKIGEEMYDAKNYESAIKQLTSALEIIPTDKKTLELRAQSYEKTKQYEQAIEDYAKLFQNNPKNEEYALNAALLSFKINKYNAAIKFSNDVLLNSHKNFKARKTVVDSYMALGDYKRARPHALKLMDDEKNKETYFRMGVIDYQIGGYKSAEIFFRQTLNLDSKNVDCMVWLAKTLDKREKYRLAKAQCIEAIRLKPRTAEIYRIKSLINEHTLNFRESIDDMTRVLMLEPENDVAYNRRAKLYLKINEKTKAIEDYKAVIKNNPKEYETYMKIVELLLSNNETKQALHYLNLVIERFSEDPEFAEKLYAVNKRIEKLQPDNVAPKITIGSHELVGNKIKLANEEETIVFYINDESALKDVIINGINVHPVMVNNKYKVLYPVNAKVTRTVLMQALDVYDNATQKEFKIDYNDARQEKAIAYNSENFHFKPTADVDFNIPTSGYRDNYSFALIIGNEDYTTNQQGLNTEVNVEFAQNDAYVFKQYTENVLGVPARNIMFYTNATSGVMSQAITKFILLMEKTAGKGTFYFYYAGHGLPDEETREPHLIPTDMNGRSLKGAVSLNEIYNKIKKIKAQKVTFFIDACFSGGARNSPLLASRGVKIRPKEPDLKGPLFVFTASSKEQSALPYKKMKHGMFTYYVLKKLKETVGDITYKDFAKDVKEKVDLGSLMINDKEQTPYAGFSPSVAKQWEEWNFIKK